MSTDKSETGNKSTIGPSAALAAGVAIATAGTVIPALNTPAKPPSPHMTEPAAVASVEQYPELEHELLSMARLAIFNRKDGFERVGQPEQGIDPNELSSRLLKADNQMLEAARKSPPQVVENVIKTLGAEKAELEKAGAPESAKEAGYIQTSIEALQKQINARKPLGNSGERLQNERRFQVHPLIG